MLLLDLLKILRESAVWGRGVGLKHKVRLGEVGGFSFDIDRVIFLLSHIYCNISPRGRGRGLQVHTKYLTNRSNVISKNTAEDLSHA